MDAQTKLKKAHLNLMRHPETVLYSGVMMLGKSEVVDSGCPTAYTDGFNKKYGRAFLDGLTLEETAFLVLHENLHVMLKHLPRFHNLWKTNAKLVNAAADYVVNATIMEIKDKALCTMPKCGLYDAKYHGWSVAEVYADLKQEQESGGGGGGDSMDEHGFDDMQDATEEQVKAMSEQIKEAIQHGAVMAGRMGQSVPQSIEKEMVPVINWTEVLAEFISVASRGKQDYSWRRFNVRRLADGYYLPSTISETVGEVVIAVDTSGSIDGNALAAFTAELAGICEMCRPEKVRVLWWDSAVHGEQTFTDNYDQIRSLLKPVGGGGTRVGSVAKYISDNDIHAECVVVLTDGYVESDVQWGIPTPTLWVVDGNKNFIPPVGNKVDLVK
jgi:predicted metal-dependent peptidase